jgi:hypothetical protein
MKEAVIHSKQKALEYYQKRLLESEIGNHIASIILYGSLIHRMGREDSINPYGDGKTGPRIANILSKIKIDRSLLQKRLTSY